MNKIVSEVIDRCALFQLHRERSSTWHFDGNMCKVEDFDTFYKDPELPLIRFEAKRCSKGYTIGSYSFKSEIEMVDKCNKYSSGLYYMSNEDKRPINVVCVHGWRSSDHRKLQNIYLEQFLNLKYNIFFATLPYHIERNADSALYNGELMISANVERTLLSIKQAVSDIRALIRWIKANKSGQVVLVGLSLGGVNYKLHTQC